MIKNIYLTGFSCTGKTTIGKLISKKLGRQFIDIDLEIERQHKKMISDIFRDSGEEIFRTIESNLLKEISTFQDTIISTGGGLPILDINRDIMKSTGHVVLLTATAVTILERLEDEMASTNSDTYRPVIEQDKDRLARITELLAYRDRYYYQADFTINTESKKPNLIVEEIIRKISDVE
jgi:shikimate kinase